MKRFIAIAGAAGIIAWCGAPALAQYANQFTLAKVKHFGTAHHGIAGSGEVTVQVQVNSNGSHKVIKVIRTTNPADNAAALDIAESSTYVPARRGTKPVVSFYDFVLKFNGKSASVGGPERGSASDAVDALVRAGKYPEAIDRAQQILAANPNDQVTLQLLGVAQYYNGDLSASAQTFDKVTDISKAFVPLAAQSYAGASVRLSQTDPAQALDYAKKAYALSPDTNAQFALGVAQLTNKQYNDAIASLKAVHDKVPDSNLKAKENIDGELLQAYLAVNDTADADTLAKEMKGLDPNGSSASHAIAQHYLQIGAQDLNGKNFTDALTAFNQAIAAGNPQDTVTADTYASFAILQMEKPDYSKAADYALKAIAASPQDAQANYAAGVAYAGLYASGHKSSDRDAALNYLTKADTYAKAAGNTALATQVEAQIKNVPH